MPTKCMELCSSMVDIAMDRVHVAKKSSSWQREREGIRCWFAKFKFDCTEPLFQVKAHSPSLIFLSHFLLVLCQTLLKKQFECLALFGWLL